VGTVAFHLLEAERAILGAVLLGGIRADEALDILQASDFFLSQNQLVFRHMKILRDQNKPTNDCVLLFEIC
jgi:replicative DNA helicase